MHYKKTDIIDGQNPSLNQNYRQILDGQKSIGRTLVGKILLTEIMFRW